MMITFISGENSTFSSVQVPIRPTFYPPLKMRRISSGDFIYFTNFLERSLT